MEARKDRKVNRGLGVAGPLKHAAWARPKREHVPGPGKVVRLGVRVADKLDGPDAVGRADPVVTPDEASTLTAKSVRFRSRLLATIGARPSLARTSPVVATHTMPLPCLIMRPIASAVALHAAMMRSPSFSRFSSSVTITIRPAAMSATADSMESNGGGWEGGIGTNSRRRVRLSIRGDAPRAGTQAALKSTT